ncbi:hypothetical protein AAVH_37444 [Aphelenchoides avenae]|nr:hypothetical protein AAVH_37444 [Aphelenchus avenae]
MARLAAAFCAVLLLVLATSIVDGAVLPKFKRPGVRPVGNTGNARNKPAVTVPLSVVGSPTTNIFWTFDVLIGGQSFNLTVDANGIKAVVFDTSYQNKGQGCSVISPNPRRLFSANSSSTLVDYGYSDSSEYYANWYFKQTCAAKNPNGATDAFVGDFARDTFQIGSSSTDSVPFVLTKQTKNPLSESWRSDGVFPLSFDQWSNEGIERWPVLTIANSFNSAELTILFGGDPRPNGDPAEGGWLTFGGKDPVHCEDKWTFLAEGLEIARYDNWWTATVLK